MWSNSDQDFAQAMAGHGDEDIVDAVQTFFKRSNRLQVVREGSAGEVTSVAFFLGHAFELFAVAAPKSNLTTATRKLQRQRGSPGAGADDRDGP